MFCFVVFSVILKQTNGKSVNVRYNCDIEYGLVCVYSERRKFVFTLEKLYLLETETALVPTQVIDICSTSNKNFKMDLVVEKLFFI